MWHQTSLVLLHLLRSFGLSIRWLILGSALTTFLFFISFGQRDLQVLLGLTAAVDGPGMKPPEWSMMGSFFLKTAIPASPILLWPLVAYAWPSLERSRMRFSLLALALSLPLLLLYLRISRMLNPPTGPGPVSHAMMGGEGVILLIYLVMLLCLATTLLGPRLLDPSLRPGVFCAPGTAGSIDAAPANNDSTRSPDHVPWWRTGIARLAAILLLGALRLVPTGTATLDLPELVEQLASTNEQDAHSAFDELEKRNVNDFDEIIALALPIVDSRRGVLSNRAASLVDHAIHYH